jgi:hypothetical protein
MSDPNLTQQVSKASTQTFVAALYLNAAVFAAEVLIFTFVRRRFKAIYEPRTYIPIESKRQQPLSGSLFGWPMAIFRADFEGIRHHNGLDAYFYVRFLRMMMMIFLPIWIISWAVLGPLYAAGVTTNLPDGLDKFTFGNVATTQQVRYAALIPLIYLFTGWIFYHLKNEMRNFITVRQRHLVDPIHSSSAQANTVLITGVPRKFLNEREIEHLFSHLPGGVKKVWLNRDLKELPDIYDRRLVACNKLESAEMTLIQTARKLQAKKDKAAKQGKEIKEKEKDPEIELTLANYLVPRDQRPSHRLPVLGFLPFGRKVDTIEWAIEEIVETNKLLADGRAILERDMIREQRRNNRKFADFAQIGQLGQSLGHQLLDKPTALIGRGVGKVAHLGDRLKSPGAGSPAVQSPAIGDRVTPAGSQSGHDLAPPPPRHELASSSKMSVDHSHDHSSAGDHTTSADDKYPPLNSVFVLFNQQIAAHMASQLLTHQAPYRMSDKYIEVAPADVIWANLNLNPYEQRLRRVISYAATAALIILWSFPVAFVGVIGNLRGLCESYTWLAWVCKMPTEVFGIIAGLLPPILLAVLMMLLPIILRLLARFEGIPRKTGIELSLMTRFFIFQVIHGFLIVTLSGGLFSALPDLLKDPTSIPTILAKNLPGASTFFMTYAILQGLAGSAGGLLQVVPLIVYYVKLFLLGSTPRSVYSIKYDLRDIAWGTAFPATTLLVVISLGYMMISPIINGLACVTFFLLYQVWKYLFLWQLDQPASGDTGGLFFPKAIQHVFVGLYVQQVCLAALFILARDQNANPSGTIEFAFMIILIIITVLFNLVLNSSYGPLIHALPLTLADKSYGMGNNENHRDIGMDDGDDFGGSSPKPQAKPDVDPFAAKDADIKRKEEETMRARAAASAKTTGLQSIDGPGPSKPYGDSVGVEGKRNDGPTDFNHPASVEPQRVIWLPEDPLGLGPAEAKALEKAGVESSTENAVMDAEGHVDVQGHPPGMDPTTIFG